MKKTIIIASILFPLICSVLFADILYLKNGRRLEGKIVKETNKGVQFQTSYGKMFFSNSDIAKIKKGNKIIKRPLEQKDTFWAGKLNNAGVQYFNAQQFDKAIASYQKALPEAADDNLKAMILFNLSSAYLEKGIIPYSSSKDDGYYKKSIAYANECLEIEPLYWQALANIATVHMNMNNLKKADHYFKLAERYTDKNSPGYKQLIAQHAMVKGLMIAREKQSKKK